MKNKEKNKQKDTDTIIDIIGDIDDDIISSALNIKRKVAPFPFKKVVSIAVGLAAVLVIGIISIVKMNVYPGSGDSEYIEGEIEDAGGYNSQSGESHSEIAAGAASGTENTFEGNTDSNNADPTYTDRDENNQSEGTAIEESDEVIGDSSCQLPESVGPGWEDELYHANSHIEINSLDKLAYYSGLKLLNQLIDEKFYSVQSQKFIKENFAGVGYDASDEYIPPATESDDSAEDVDIQLYPPEIQETIENIPPYIAPEYIPIDPGFEGDVLVYGVYEITITGVRYFKINLTLEDNFLSKQVGTGIIEVMILDLSLSGIGEEQMMVVRNKDKYFSCLSDSYYVGENYSQYFGFTASKYVSNFSVVKAPALSEYNFGIAYRNDDNQKTMLDFIIQGGPYVEVFQDSYREYLNFEPYVVTAHDMDREMYNIYVQNIIAGITKPIMPEFPTEILPPTDVFGCLNSTFVGEGNLESISGENTGWFIYNGNSEKLGKIKDAFQNTNFAEIADSFMLADMPFAVMWVKGRGAVSQTNIESSNGNPALSVEYILFDNSDVYTMFIFETTGVKSIIPTETVYSTSVDATFYSLGEDGTENLIILCTDGRYRVETVNSTSLNYAGEYKISFGQLCLATDGDTYYLDISENSTIEYEGRVYSLLGD